LATIGFSQYRLYLKCKRRPNFGISSSDILSEDDAIILLREGLSGLKRKKRKIEIIEMFLRKILPLSEIDAHIPSASRLFLEPQVGSLRSLTIDQLFCQSIRCITKIHKAGWCEQAVRDLGLYVEEINKRSLSMLIMGFRGTSGCIDELYEDVVTLATAEGMSALELLSKHLDIITLRSIVAEKYPEKNKRLGFSFHFIYQRCILCIFILILLYCIFSGLKVYWLILSGIIKDV
jgi:hypothetical protein